MAEIDNVKLPDGSTYNLPMSIEVMKEIEKVFKRYSADFHSNKGSIRVVLDKLAENIDKVKEDILKAFVVYFSLSKTMAPENSVSQIKVVDNLPNDKEFSLFIENDFKTLSDKTFSNHYEYEFEGVIDLDNQVGDQLNVVLTLTVGTMLQQDEDRRSWFEKELPISDMHSREEVSFYITETVKWIKDIQDKIIKNGIPVRSYN